MQSIFQNLLEKCAIVDCGSFEPLCMMKSASNKRLTGRELGKPMLARSRRSPLRSRSRLPKATRLSAKEPDFDSKPPDDPFKSLPR